MNENLNLIEILKDCPKGTKFYTPVWGEVSFKKLLEDKIYAISIDTCSGNICLTREGCYLPINDAECIIFPSKEQRDWSKFKPKKPKFDPKTFQPFDKVLAFFDGIWNCDLYSHYSDFGNICVGVRVRRVIPYNEDTKHLLGTTEEAPEFYRYWEE